MVGRKLRELMDMRFITSEPVTGDMFFGRKHEMKVLQDTAMGLKQGYRDFYALWGVRKVGKSSILYELKRRLAADRELGVVIVDCYQYGHDPDEFFSHLAVQVMNEFLIKQGHAARTGLFTTAKDPAFTTLFAETASKARQLNIAALDRGIEAVLATEEGEPHYFIALDLAQMLAEEQGMFFQVIFDEFQEMAGLKEHPKIREALGDLFKCLRVQWTLHHKRVNYIVTGSRLALIQALLSDPQEPLFGHFTPLTIRELPRPEAVEMIDTLLERAGYTMANEGLREQVIDITNSTPYYLQVLIKDMAFRIGEGGLIDAPTFKNAVQNVFFDSDGVLYAHFERYLASYVGEEPSLEKVLISIATGHTTIEEMSQDLRATPAMIKKWLTPLLQMRAIKEAGNAQFPRYVFYDPVFGFWIRGARSHLRGIAGPYLVGTEVERELARYLGAHGLELIYQTRASRGPFDLLVVYERSEVGLQVKKVKRFALRLSPAEHRRMVHHAQLFGKTPIICLYDGHEFRFYKLDDLQETERGYSITAQTPYTENPLRLVVG